MKTRLCVCLCLALAPGLPAQEPVPVVTTVAPALLTAEQLEQLLAPIALYPDALIAIILPASTAPVDLVLAARYLKEGGDPATASNRAWDESVKSLAHYPEVVRWMDDNIEWTKQVGEAFLAQPAEVMKAIQRLRARAQAAGMLTNTPQQQVVVDGGIISIVPAQPDVIYVPRYAPEVVFVERPVYYVDPWLTFGVGYAVGPWLTYDCDWWHHTVWVVNRHWSWREHRDWRRPAFPGQPGYVADPHRQPWRPPPNTYRPPPPALRWPEFVRPTPMPGTPTYAQGGPRRLENPLSMPQPEARPRDSSQRRPPVVAVQPAATVPSATTPPTPPTPPPAARPSLPRPPRSDPIVRPPRLDNTTNAVAARPASPTPETAVPAAPPTRNDATARPPRTNRGPDAVAHRPATNPPALPAPAGTQLAFAGTPAPQRSFPFAPPPSTPAVAPITGPVVAPFSPPPQPRAAQSPPAPAIVRTFAPVASPQPPPAAVARGPAPAVHPAPQASPQPPPQPHANVRDDKDKKRNEP